MSVNHVQERQGSDMNTVATKIKETRLFTDQEKIELLARILEIPDKEKVALTKIIEDFDAKVTQAKGAFLEHVQQEVTKLKALDAGKNQELASAALQAVSIGAQAVASGVA